MVDKSLDELLRECSSRHDHLCPRQVLGIRIGLAGAAALGLSPRGGEKRLLAIVETDGCFTDGVEVATGCTVGHRTLRVEDYGKIATTFVDIRTGRSLRIAPRRDLRERAQAFSAGEPQPYYAQLTAYQTMAEQDLLTVKAVSLALPIEKIISQPGLRVICSKCGEEIINEREIVRPEGNFCRACAGNAYYRTGRGQR